MSAHTKIQVKELDGTFSPTLPGLNKGHLFNAENLTITRNGRLFVTGSKGIYEITKNEQRYAQNRCPIVVQTVPKGCLSNGITNDDQFVYVVCTHMHNQHSIMIDRVACRGNEVEQTVWNLPFRTFLSRMCCQVDSYLLRANLSSKKVEFTEAVKLRSELTLGDDVTVESDSNNETSSFFANGLDIDKDGTLYITNTYYTRAEEKSLCITTVKILGGAKMVVKQASWFRAATPCSPNGIKTHGDTIYYTDSGIPTKLIKVDSDGSLQAKSSVVYNAGLSGLLSFDLPSVFDDFDVMDSGFIVADFSRGRIVFLHKVEDEYQPYAYIKRPMMPSAVKVVRNQSTLFEKGDIIIIDKMHHCVSLFRPVQDCKHGRR